MNGLSDPHDNPDCEHQDPFLTSHTLIRSLQRNPNDQAGWQRFAEKYTPLIRLWSRQWKLQEADAEDLTQNVLLEISRCAQLAQFRREGRFRYWLKTIVYRSWCDLLKRLQRPGGGSGDSQVLQLLHNVAARDNLLHRLDQEYRQEILELAMIEVRNRVQPHTFEAWRMMSLEHATGEATADALNMSTGAVFVAKSRVDRFMSETVRRLDADPNVEMLHTLSPHRW
ncbi:MAG: sigma-70 family RNA polymerase sigma factor [Planctomycetaceae bacterium]|nr:sigma-70 family RNA polymerase sigma factor [Planctomycetaceae bacterium]